jgi:hypothetical protein
MFNGNEVFETNCNVVKSEAISGAIFDHTLITVSMPTKTTDYTEATIKLGQDYEDTGNIIAFKPTTASELVADRLAKMRQKD